MKWKAFFKEWVLPIAAVFLIATLIQRFVFFQVLVPTASMHPTIGEGDRMLVVREYRPKSLQRGDIVVFTVRQGGEDVLYIKRLIGRPGDRIVIENGEVSVNGERLKEEYVVYRDRFNGVYTVPQNAYFFMGDNRANSSDSRYPLVGYVPEKNIIAKAGLRFWPLRQFGFLK